MPSATVNSSAGFTLQTRLPTLELALPAIRLRAWPWLRTHVEKGLVLQKTTLGHFEHVLFKSITSSEPMLPQAQVGTTTYLPADVALFDNPCI